MTTRLGVLELIFELDIFLVVPCYLLLVHLTQFLRDHRTGEHVSGKLLLTVDNRRLLSCLRGRSVDLILNWFSYLYHLSEASAEIFDLEVSSSNWALILLCVIIIGIDPLVIIESCHVVMVVILHLMLAGGSRSGLLGDGGHRLKV